MDLLSSILDSMDKPPTADEKQKELRRSKCGFFLKIKKSVFQPFVFLFV